jgi:hypothetical protein
MLVFFRVEKRRNRVLGSISNIILILHLFLRVVDNLSILNPTLLINFLIIVLDILTNSLRCVLLPSHISFSLDLQLDLRLCESSSFSLFL